jgi:hypothetical protein
MFPAALGLKEIFPAWGGAWTDNYNNTMNRTMNPKTNPADELNTALANCEAVEAALSKEAKFLVDSSAELRTLQKTIDISDVSQVHQMGTLLTIAQVGSPRRVFRHQENMIAQKALIDISQSFVSKVFVPRLRDLQARATAKVEAKLKLLFPDKEALRSAAQHSTELLALAQIEMQAKIFSYQQDDAIRQAKILLKAWEAADAFEQLHLS